MKIGLGILLQPDFNRLTTARVELHKTARLGDHAQHPSKWLAKFSESLDASACSSAQVRVSKQGNALGLVLAMKLLDSWKNQEAGKQHQKQGPNA